MAYVIGIDVGGTKTECLFQRIDIALSNNVSQNHELPIITGEGCNPNVVGYKRMKKILEKLIKQGLDKYSIPPTEISSICIGLAGVGRDQEKEQVEHRLLEIIAKLDLSENIPYFICNDAHIALRGALSPTAKEGILVISGTGSVAFGINREGENYRSGGWGHILGDEGSGYEIGLQALRKVCSAFDQREKKTLITQLVLKELNLNTETELISYMYTTPKEKKEIAFFAKFVIQASEENDEVASKILKRAAAELVQHVKSLFRQTRSFDSSTPVVTAGSIFQYSSIIQEYFKREIKEEKLGSYHESISSPVEGAARIAAEMV